MYAPIVDRRSEFFAGGGNSFSNPEYIAPRINATLTAVPPIMVGGFPFKAGKWQESRTCQAKIIHSRTSNPNDLPDGGSSCSVTTTTLPGSSTVFTVYTTQWSSRGERGFTFLSLPALYSVGLQIADEGLISQCLIDPTKFSYTYPTSSSLNATMKVVFVEVAPENRASPPSSCPPWTNPSFIR